MQSSQAFVIVDAQINMFDEEFSIYQSEKIIKVLTSLIDKARQRTVPVIFVRNNGGDGEPDETGTLGWEIHPALKPTTNEIVIDKHGPDAFENTKLKEYLDEQGITQIVIAGM